MLRKFFLVFLVSFLSAAFIIVSCGLYLYYSNIQKQLLSIINEVEIAAFSKDVDLSTDKTAECQQNMTGNVWLISYADGGEVHLANQRALTSSALNKCIDFYKPYNKKHISSSYVKAHENIFSQKKGAGYWLWKPYIVNETLKKMNDGDYLFYMDSIYYFTEDFTNLYNDYLKENDFLIWENKPNESTNPMKMLCKMDVIKKYNMEKAILSEKANEYWAGSFLLKKTEKTVEIIKEWLKMCCNKHDLTDEPSNIPNQPEFFDHRHDQSLLSIVLMKHNIPAQVFEKRYLQNVRYPY